MGVLVVAAVDVGAVRNIGWWRTTEVGGAGGQDLDVLAAALTADLDAGCRVALGFEAPLFIPRPSSTDALNKQRVGDRGRPWCAGAGTGALAMGIQQATYLLSLIATIVRTRPVVSFDPGDLLTGAADLVVWEAFVSGKAKNRLSTDPHVDDARAAVNEFRARLATGTVTSDIEETDVLNLAAAALLAAGLTANLGMLTEPCVVVRAPDYLTSEMPPLTRP